MKTLTIGKIRGLQQCATARGALTIFALDHRNNLRGALHPENPSATTTEEMSTFKQSVIAALAPQASAVLLDPEVGGAQCIASGALPGTTGLVMAVEATGYTGDPAARQSRILPGWSVAKAKRMGASAIKLLAYYHPDSPTAGEVENLVHQVAADCAVSDIPLFLEPLSYSLNPDEKKLSGAERRRVVGETARRLVIPGVDALKAEFPLDVVAEPDERVWADACLELSETSPAPWVLLSAAVSYETYLRQVTIACRNGASGVAVGRAVWKEAVSVKGSERERFLTDVARERMSRITNLCDALAQPWTSFYAAPAIGDSWYQGYEA